MIELSVIKSGYILRTFVMPDCICTVSTMGLFATANIHMQGDMPYWIGLGFYIHLFSKGHNSATPSGPEQHVALHLFPVHRALKAPLVTAEFHF